MNRKEKTARTEELYRKILRCMEVIAKCEDELAVMGMDDINACDGMTTETLWRNFRRVQSGRSDLQRNLRRYGEDPCHAVAALLERELLSIPLSGLLLRECTIGTRDKSALWCISGELDERTSGQIRVWSQQ